ncbi:VENN motif pre-toxin domain-containing protein [Ewingella sp. S1.OA.A_B6]
MISTSSARLMPSSVIGSMAAADKNRLDTGTLGFSNIENRAEYEVEHQSVGISSGGNIGGQFVGNVANSLLVGVNGSGSDSSTTRSAVSDGSLIIRDPNKQTQNVDELSRDVEHANQTLSPIFDKEKEQNRLKEAQLIGEIGTQAMDIARTQGKIEATKAGKAELEKHGVQQPGKDATKEERAAYDKALTETAGYKTAQQKWGTGSAIQQGLQAATAAVQGLAGGDMAKALAGASAPYLAEVIHNMTTSQDGKTVNTEANLMAHAVVGAVVAQISGNGALAGASGAVAGEYIAQQMYPGVDRENLSEEQRQTISALSTLAAGLAGGLAGDSSADTVAGAQAGKNASENNALSSTQALAFDKELSDCRKSGGDCQAVIDKWKQVSDKQSAETDDKLKDNPLEAVVIDKEVAQGGIDMAQRPAWLDNIGADVMTDEQAKAYVQYWNAQDLTNIDVNSPGWTKFAAFASDPENQAAVASLGMLGKDLIVIAKNSLVTKSLFKEMATQGIKFTPENVVSAAKDNSGKIIFLEKGNSSSGLQHIVEEHGSQFAKIGVSEARIPDVIMKTVTDGKIVGYQGTGTGRPIYETMINGEKYNIAVTVGNNGYIVGANLRGSVK